MVVRRGRACFGRPQPERTKDDTTQLEKQMTKATNTLQLSQSSQHPKQDPTKHQKNLSRRRTRHQMFFLLVFLQDKFISIILTLSGV